MSEIIGYEKEKKELAVIRKMLRHAEEYRQHGVRIPRGLLLIGRPGVGKTALARTLAGDEISLVELRAATCCSEDAPAAVHSVFAEAREKTPCVLLLDELDKIAGECHFYYKEGNDRVRKTLLQELDALTDTDRVLVVATCNHEREVSGELTRPGRFDRQIHLNVPDAKTREKILRSYFEKVQAEKNFNMKMLVRNTDGYTGADLECLVNDAGILAMQKDVPFVTEDDLRLVINKMEFGANEQDPFEDKRFLHGVAVHEAGHAFAALYLDPEHLFGASIMPQGTNGGHVRVVQNSEQWRTVRDRENEVAIALAGHVAERIVLGEYSVGSAKDITSATVVLKKLIVNECAYGYEFPAGTMGDFEDRFLSPNDKEKINLMMKNKLNEADRTVSDLMWKHRDVYDKILVALEKKRILSREELLTFSDWNADSVEK